MHRIVKIGRFDHVVLFVAAEPMLRSQSRAEPDVAKCPQRIERMGEIPGHRRRVGEQSHAAAGERPAQRRFFQQSVDTGDRVEFVEVKKGVFTLVAATRDVRELKGMVSKPSKPVSIEEMNRTIARMGGKR